MPNSHFNNKNTGFVVGYFTFIGIDTFKKNDDSSDARFTKLETDNLFNLRKIPQLKNRAITTPPQIVSNDAMRAYAIIEPASQNSNYQKKDS